MTIESCSLECEILKILAKLHIATHQRMFELFREFPHQDVLKAIENLKEADYLYVQDCEIPAPYSGKVTATTKKVSVKTYSLNFKSRPIIFKRFPELLGYRREKPQGLRYKARIYHDLLCTEAVVYLSKRLDIADIYNEEYLQRCGETMSDLQIEVDTGGGNFEYLNCEIVVSNTKKDIENKPDETVFFTYSSYQADIIYSIKGIEPIILTVDGDEVIDQKTYFDLENTFESLDLINDLNHAGGALTAPALVQIIEKDAAQTASILRKLEEKGFLFADRIHRNAENPTGNRTKIYATNRDFIRERSDRMFALMLSNLILKFENWQLVNVLRNRRLAFFITENGTKTVFYLENNERSVIDEQLIYRSICANESLSQYNILYNFASETRMIELKDAREIGVI